MSDFSQLKQQIATKSVSIGVMGLGYVGLPTALYFAKMGFRVYGFDVDKKKISILQNKKLPFYDVGLEDVFDAALKLNKITFHDDTDCLNKCQIVLVIVPTPVNDQKVPDLSYIIDAGKFIGSNLIDNQIVILESTVYPGVTSEVLGPTIEKVSGKKAGKDFHLAYVPERYNPGDEKHTLTKLKRVIGADSPGLAVVLDLLYSEIIEIDDAIMIVSNTKTAEASKVIENTQRDLNIALMNEIALICERLGIDSIEVIEAAATKWNFIKYFPGAGVGGHCLPHDPYYLTAKAKELGYNPEIILSGRRLNDWMPYHMTELIQTALNKIKKPVNSSKIIVLGAAYKENTGDLRSSPSEIVVKNLVKKGAEVIVIDSNILTDEDTIWGTTLIKDIEKVSFENTAAVVLMTSHSEFSEEFLLKIRKNMPKDVVLIDGRRKINYEKIKDHYYFLPLGSGLEYNLK